MKLKDIFNKKVNSRNGQISLDARKTKLKEYDCDLDDLMEMNIDKKLINKFKKERKW